MTFAPGLARDSTATMAAGAAGERPTARPRSRARRVMGFVVAVGLALVALWPAQFGGITGLTVVNGRSMEPTYYTGDLVVSLKLPAYAAGDIVSYVVPAGEAGEGGRVIHRIFSIDATSAAPILSSKGDNNPNVDPWRFSVDDVMGKALFSIPTIGSVLGGVTNPIVVGLASGLLVTILLWRLGSVPQKRRQHGSS